MTKPKSSPILDLADFPVGLVRTNIIRGTGVDLEELRRKPMIAVVNSHTEINPGHMHLRELATRVKEGIHSAGGIPFECNVPAVCDGITEGHEGMRFVLPQRDLIADMVETHVRSMLFDGVVMITACDKITPGMLMAAARLDLPTIFLTGGPNAWAIRFMAGKRDSVDHKDYDNLEMKLATATCSTCGSCELIGTANTFQCLTEALGMTIPGSATVPAFHVDRLLLARKTGIRIVEMVKEGLTARTILTREALLNALMVDLAIGGSTNTALHLPALAHTLGFQFPLSLFNEYNRKIPTLCSLSPNGPHGVIDLYSAGGIPAVMKALSDDLNPCCITVMGKTVKEVIQEAQVKDTQVVRPKDAPFQPEGSTVILTGNLAPEGAVVKQSSVIPEMKTFTAAAKVFESESDALKAFRDQKVTEGRVLVIRNEGPKGGPGMPEILALTMALDLSGIKNVALITDGRFSGASYGPCVGHVSPEAFVGGPIAAVQDGDTITIDIPRRTIELHLSAEVLNSRRKAYTPPPRKIPCGYMRRYRKLVSSAAQGAVLEE